LVFATILVLVMALPAMRNDGAVSQKLARVRVRIEENRRRNLSKQPEEDLELARVIELLMLSILLLFICMLLIRV
jgi:uncharacterized membrane protein